MHDLLDVLDQFLGLLALGHLLPDDLGLGGFKGIVQVSQQGSQGQTHRETPYSFSTPRGESANPAVCLVSYISAIFRPFSYIIFPCFLFFLRAIRTCRSRIRKNAGRGLVARILANA